MHITKIDNPNTKAEGLCDGLPYTTDTYNINGCAIHFWVPDCTLLARIKSKLDTTLRKAMNARDIVRATWSFGEPTGFWAHQDIE